MDSIYITPEHELLRDQIARFIAHEVEPHGLAWERDGMTPRAVLRKMGAAGLLGLMYALEHGGADADALTNLVFAEALSQSTFGGFIITVLVHTDMASPHLHHAGTPAQQARWMPGITSGQTIAAVAISEPGAGSDVAGLRTMARRAGDEWVRRPQFPSPLPSSSSPRPCRVNSRALPEPRSQEPSRGIGRRCCGLRCRRCRWLRGRGWDCPGLPLRSCCCWGA